MTWFPFDPNHFGKDYAVFGGLVSAFAVENELQARREHERLASEPAVYGGCAASGDACDDDYDDDEEDY
jgi:hypothetical protein